MEKIKIPTITEWSQEVQENWIPYWLANLPIILMAAILVAVIYCGYKLWRGWQLKRRQNAVDQTINELVDREKTSRLLFWHQLRIIGIINDQEDLVLEGKYGPGIASDLSMAKITARLMLDRFIPSERLAKAVVDHFMINDDKVFEKRRGHLEAFWYQVNSCFSDRKSDELTERDMLSAAIAQILGYYLQQEDDRLEYLAKVKEKEKSDRRNRAFNLAYGLENTFWQIWLAVVWARLLNIGNHLKQADPAKADTLP